MDVHLHHPCSRRSTPSKAEGIRLDEFRFCPAMDAETQLQQVEEYEKQRGVHENRRQARVVTAKLERSVLARNLK
ncbi:hypothetical protein Mapa_006681 [Marchantia paleacea]|nr:hypothetical protein Mapa_006681 [Marchantia paleacea]